VKITKSKLRRIIKEEVAAATQEEPEWDAEAVALLKMLDELGTRYNSFIVKSGLDANENADKVNQVEDSIRSAREGLDSLRWKL
tara:strand:- start:342 stop:593 length:252 start_codon:yes stop_codon:yes gene_type:complete